MRALIFLYIAFGATALDSSSSEPENTGAVHSLLGQASDLLSQARILITQSDCRTQTVVSGDSCGALASRCGISGADFTKYNPAKDLCATLTPGQRVCCSPGSLPDVRPKPNSDGSCAAYLVQSGDTCSAIATKNGLKADDLAKFNDKVTWGWSGCDRLMAELKICLSTGKPPMPAPIPNAVCGPIKPGTKPPSSSQSLTDLNPCPLNSCCNIWGQCGITPEYCTRETGVTGNPGTAPPNKNGCISNCGTEIKKSSPPSSFLKIGYYESWNYERSCLNMKADSLSDTDYSHIHWSFAAVNDNMDVVVTDKYNQFAVFTGLNGVKKILSFGGWGFSTDPATFDKLRKAMSPEQRDRFASNVVNFIQKNKLDGVDFDWEYPGAPDIPGIPPGLESDAPNYLAFLKLIRGKLPKEKSLSIAAPASYWYLKQFPISEMAAVLDYIVYMAYDLHGQWDYGNKWSQEGCPAGNCLRSHVNMTETMYALAMITKAGAPANKISVGVSSYGRSFGMVQPGCKGPMCPFGGPASTATPGRCTITAGYISNAEINEIISFGRQPVDSWYDKESDSDMLVYNGNQWVAYMSDTTKNRRIGAYKNMGFGGTVDWAVDLRQYEDDDGYPPDVDDDDDDDGDAPPPSRCDANFNTIEDLDGAIGSIPQECQGKYMASTLQNVLTASVKQYNDMMSHGYDGKFKTYAKAVSDSAGKTVQDFVNNNGNKYFTCVVGETAICCDDCKGKNGNGKGDPCAYCFQGKCYQTCNTVTGCPQNNQHNVHAMNKMVEKYKASLNGTVGQMDTGHLMGQVNSPDAHDGHDQMVIGGPVIRDHPGPVQVPIAKPVKENEPCPPDYSKRGYGPDDPWEQSVWWTLKNDQADQFWADLLTNTGIPKNKIKFDKLDRGNDCPPSAKDDDTCWWTGMDYGMPTPNGYGEGDVTNPKTLVQKALDNSNNLVSQLALAVDELIADAYLGDASELVDSVSVPILMIAEAVDSMAQIEEVADKIDEEKRKALILAFIGAILFFVPIAGELLGSVAELADIASIISILGVAGNVAMDVYTIVDDPQNAPLAIFSLVLEPLALTNLAKISQIASIRRGMKDADIAKLGGKVAGRLGTLRKITGICHKAP